MLVCVWVQREVNMVKKILFFMVSFLYTLLYVLILDTSIFIWNLAAQYVESADIYSASSHDIRSIQFLFIAILGSGVILLVVFQFDRLSGAFGWMYFPSLLASFLIPLFFNSLNSGGFISFSWYFTGTVLVVLNFLFGPAMLFLLSYFTVKIVKKLKISTYIKGIYNNVKK
jgi:hypothetical protein